MPTLTHRSATAAHYNKEAEHYDKFNASSSKQTNKVIADILKKHKIKSVLDLACGTGSQVFWLAQRGFSITGADINLKMLNIAKNSAKQKKIKPTLLKGDMRTIKVGKFDAVLTIFNAVGHLTKPDFAKAMRNIHKNLNPAVCIYSIFLI